MLVMTRLRLHRKLSCFLVLLLLSNSSLALEILTHEGHQHPASAVEHDAHAMHSVSADAMESVTMPTAEHGGEDCICDEICCVSSIGFGLSADEPPQPPTGDSSDLNPNFYNSVSIDLLLPPPTR